MTINAILPWFGAKRRLAGRIVELLGDHQMYVEPMCGSLAVLLSKPPAKVEVVGEIHGELINLAMCLASEHWRVIRQYASRCLMCHALATAFVEQRDPGYRAPASPDAVMAVDLTRAGRFLACSWMQRHGVAGRRENRTTSHIRWDLNGGSGAVRWRSMLNSIERWHERLVSVEIVQKDVFEVLERLDDDSRIALYLDPPYPLMYRNERGHGYAFDWGATEHEKLHRALERFRKTRVVLSYPYEFAVENYGHGYWVERHSVPGHTRPIDEGLVTNFAPACSASQMELTL